MYTCQRINLKIGFRLCSQILPFFKWGDFLGHSVLLATCHICVKVIRRIFVIIPMYDTWMHYHVEHFKQEPIVLHRFSKLWMLITFKWLSCTSCQLSQSFKFPFLFLRLTKILLLYLYFTSFMNSLICYKQIYQ